MLFVELLVAIVTAISGILVITTPITVPWANHRLLLAADSQYPGEALWVALNPFADFRMYNTSRSIFPQWQDTTGATLPLYQPYPARPVPVQQAYCPIGTSLEWSSNWSVCEVDDSFFDDVDEQVSAFQSLKTWYGQYSWTISDEVLYQYGIILSCSLVLFVLWIVVSGWQNLRNTLRQNKFQPSDCDLLLCTQGLEHVHIHEDTNATYDPIRWYRLRTQELEERRVKENRDAKMRCIITFFVVYSRLLKKQTAFQNIKKDHDLQTVEYQKLQETASKDAQALAEASNKLKNLQAWVDYADANYKPLLITTRRQKVDLQVSRERLGKTGKKIEDLQKDLQAQQEQQEELESELDGIHGSYSSKIAELQQAGCDKDATITKLRTQWQTATFLVADLQKEINAYSSKLAELQQAGCGKDATITKLQAQLQTANKKVADLQKEIKAKEQEKKRLETELDERKVEYDRADIANGLKVDELKVSNSGKDLEIQSLVEACRKQKAELGELRAAGKSKDKKIGLLEAASDPKDVMINDLTKTGDKQQSVLGKLRSTNREQMTKMKELEVDGANKDAKIQELETASRNQELELREVQNSSHDQGVKIQDLVAAATGKDNRVSELEATCRKQESELGNLKSAYRDSVTKIDELETAATSRNTRIGELAELCRKQESKYNEGQSISGQQDTKIQELATASADEVAKIRELEKTCRKQASGLEHSESFSRLQGRRIKEFDESVASKDSMIAELQATLAKQGTEMQELRDAFQSQSSNDEGDNVVGASIDTEMHEVNETSFEEMHLDSAPEQHGIDPSVLQISEGVPINWNGELPNLAPLPDFLMESMQTDFPVPQVETEDFPQGEIQDFPQGETQDLAGEVDEGAPPDLEIPPGYAWTTPVGPTYMYPDPDDFAISGSSAREYNPAQPMIDESSNGAAAASLLEPAFSFTPGEPMMFDGPIPGADLPDDPNLFAHDDAEFGPPMSPTLVQRLVDESSSAATAQISVEASSFGYDAQPASSQLTSTAANLSIDPALLANDRTVLAMNAGPAAAQEMIDGNSSSASAQLPTQSSFGSETAQPVTSDQTSTVAEPPVDPAPPASAETGNDTNPIPGFVPPQPDPLFSVSCPLPAPRTGQGSDLVALGASAFGATVPAPAPALAPVVSQNADAAPAPVFATNEDSDTILPIKYMNNEGKRRIAPLARRRPRVQVSPTANQADTANQCSQLAAEIVVTKQNVEKLREDVEQPGTGCCSARSAKTWEF